MTNPPLCELSWFMQRVERGRTEIFHEVVTITPEIARHILDNNPDNRNVSDLTVKGMAEDIRNNRWALNGETIIIANTGVLNDGQHRLWAVIEANKPIQSLMVFGVERHSRTTTDMGRQRTTADFIHMENMDVMNVNYVASSAGLWLNYRKKRFSKTSSPKQEVLAFYAQHKKEIELATQFILSTKDFRRYNANALIVARCILREVADHDDVEDFFEKIRTGAGLEIGDPRLRMRNQLNIISGYRRRTLFTRPWYILEIVLRYWNAWRKEKLLSKNIHMPNNFDFDVMP